MSTSVRVRIRLTEVNRSAWITVGLGTAGLLIAFFAQRAIYESGRWLAAALIYLSALLIFFAAIARRGAEDAVPVRGVTAPSRPRTRAHPARKLFVLPALLFAFLAFIALHDNQFNLPGVLAWLTALALFVFACWEGSPRAVWADLRARLAVLGERNARGTRARLLVAALVGITALGVFFYMYRLDAVPAEMTSDHAEKILDTYDILHGKFSIFFERNTGREPLQFYLNALVVALGLAPLDMLALKIVGATAGVLTIPAVFLLAREWFDDEVGLYAAFLFAVSIFPVAIARIGLRYPLSPLFVAWTCFFLVRALRTRSRNAFLLAGLMLGLGLNGYSPFRVVVLLVLVWLGLWLILDQDGDCAQLPRLAVNVGLLFAAAFLVFVPLFRYLAEHPERFAYRMATRLTSLEEPVPGDPLTIFLDNNVRAAGMFNVRGDVVWVNAIPNVPVVDWILGALFLLGVAYGVYRLVRFRESPFFLLLTALLILLLPSTLSLAFPEENPSVVRAGGVAPMIMILAALPLALWRRQFARANSPNLGLFAAGAVMFGMVLLNYNLYFVRYDEQYRRAAWNSTEIAQTLRQFALAEQDWTHIYIVSAPHWVDHRAVGIHLGIYDFDDHLVESADQLRKQAQDPAPKLYALKNQDREDLDLLKSLYPNGAVIPMPSQTPGRDYVVFIAPPPK